MLTQLLQPRTDAGVLVQAAVVVALAGAAAWRLRHDRDLRRLVLGGGVFVLGLMALRAAH